VFRIDLCDIHVHKMYIAQELKDINEVLNRIHKKKLFHLIILKKRHNSTRKKPSNTDSTSH
jgi:hypothetical protein